MSKWKGDKGFVVCIMTLGLLLVLSGFAMAVTYDFGNERKLYVTGYVQTQFGFGFDNEPSFDASQGQYLTTGNTNGLNQVLMEGYLENHLKWGRNLEARLTLRLWGDEVDSFRSGGSTNGSSWDNTYGRADDEINFGRDLRNPDREIRECNVGYFSRYFAFRIGKQQLVWGESDGMRLMDQINPLDLRRGPIYDADEGFINTRIPLWMIKTDFYSPESFELAGIRDLDLELTWIPDVEPWNRYEIGPRKGGTWAYPVPDGYYLGPGLGLRQLNVHSDTPDRTLDNSSFGARLKFSWFDANVTLNYFYGWSGDGYLAPDENLVPGLGYGLNVWNQSTGNVGDGNGLVFDVWKKTYRQKTTGFTVSRQLTFLQPLMMKLFRQFDTPILRIEALYQFDKKYNVFDPGLKALGLPLAMNLPVYGPSGRYVKESDEIRYMVGLDFFALRIPWVNSKDKVTLSMQFFHFHINNYDNKMYQAPYDWPLKRNAYAYSVLVSTGYWRQQIRPQVIFFRDMTYDSYFVKPRVQIDIGDHWRYEIGGYIFEGYHNERQFGLYDRRDTAYVKVKYQF